VSPAGTKKFLGLRIVATGLQWNITITKIALHLKVFMYVQLESTLFYISLIKSDKIRIFSNRVDRSILPMVGLILQHFPLLHLLPPNIAALRLDDLEASAVPGTVVLRPR
jgi:hypothetical protein